MKRREFIILTGVGATSAGVLSACGNPENKLIPALIPDEQYVPGIDYWKASTCSLCSAGCGITVRTREHKANKIEGNPLHPVNRGALCARGQAGLQVLYNPDRIKNPQKRVGERGSGQFAEISWDEAIKTLADRLREIKAQGQAKSSVMITGDSGGVNSHVANRFMAAYGSRAIVSRPLFDEGDSPAVFDIANSTYLLSLGARFLETWHSPVMYSLSYGEFRRSSGKTRGRFVHVEPRMSLTAANADEWLPAAIDTEGLVALAIAQVMAREGLNKTAVSPEVKTALEEYAPEKTADRIDVSADKIVRIAREFAAAERPLAVGTGSLSPWIDLLNTLVDNVNKKGGVLLPPQRGEYYGPLEKLRPADRIETSGDDYLASMLDADSLSALLIHSFNPMRMTPEVRQKIIRIPLVASFSSFLDETTELADLILPDHCYLESWDIRSSYPGSGGMVVAISQPVVSPEFGTRQTADVLLALSRELGDEMANALPFESAEEIVKQGAEGLNRRFASTGDSEPDEFWNTFSEKGVWIETAQAKPEVGATAAALPRHDLVSQMSRLPKPGQTDDEYRLTLLVYEDAVLGDGSFANLPTLQELPDPMTSAMWGSWVEINPKTARELGIADGDLVEVKTPHGSLRVPAVSYPGIRPDTIAMPFGQGHTSFGRYARGTGVNPSPLLNPALNSYSVRAKVSRISAEGKLIRFGTSLPEHLEHKR
jgi:menaquinone reductase, molybdopterin-binding-like subunit